MAGTGISESILFSAAIVLAIAFVGVFAVIIAGAGGDLEDQGSRVSHGMQTDIVILSDPEALQTAPLLLYAKNTGSTPLHVPDVQITLDGEVSQDVTADVLGSADDTTWPPGAVVAFTVGDLSVSSGEHRARVVTGPGVHAGLVFQG